MVEAERVCIGLEAGLADPLERAILFIVNSFSLVADEMKCSLILVAFEKWALLI